MKKKAEKTKTIRRLIIKDNIKKKKLEPKLMLAIFSSRKFRSDSVQGSMQTVLPRWIQFQWHDLSSSTNLNLIVTRLDIVVFFFAFLFDRL